MSHELLTPNEMGRADKITIDEGTPGIILMENAGKAIVDCVIELAASHQPVTIFAGPGNNGGDGFVAARLLGEQGYSVTLGLLGALENLHGDAALAAEKWAGEVVNGLEMSMPETGLIVDALFGAGLDRPLTGDVAELVININETGLPVVAVDLPSGLNGATGAVEGVAISAVATVTFFRGKPGHYLLPGRSLCGALHIADIGIRASTLEPEMSAGTSKTGKSFPIHPALWLNTPDLWLAHWPVPGAAGHKFSRGHTLAVSGPASQTGAARLAAMSALRAGSGLVTLASSGSAMMVNASHLTAIMLARADDANELATLLEDERLNSLIIGPGCGVTPQTHANVLAGLQAGCACTLDADALSCFEQDRDTLIRAIASNDKRGVVLTPHGGEFARLFPGIVGMCKLDAARQAANLIGAVIVLKGADTIIAAPDGRAAINDNAPPWLATAGSGDCLAGMVAGLQAQGMPAFEAAAMSVWLHGESGNAMGIGLIAEDLPHQLPKLLSALLVDLKQ